MINVENFKLARKWVLDMPHFSMSDWLETYGAISLGDSGSILDALRQHEIMPCGTVACLGGTIEAYIAYDNMSEYYTLDGAIDDEVVLNFLGVTDYEADQLFYNALNYYGDQNLDEVTKQDVIDKLDEIISTGEFNGRTFYNEIKTNHDFVRWMATVTTLATDNDLDVDNQRALNAYVAKRSPQEFITRLELIQGPVNMWHDIVDAANETPLIAS